LKKSVNFAPVSTRETARHEGLRLKPYLCPAGKLTIGIGRNPDRDDGSGTAAG
jgi:GH24 family phage-related lysozyme (muramidase)